MAYGIYELNNNVVISLLSINNGFYQNIANIGKNLALQGKAVVSDFNAGYFPAKDDNSVVALLRDIPPFYQVEGNNNLLDELAWIRYHMGFALSDVSEIVWTEETKEMYALDYLLLTSVCLVEIFNEGNDTVEKLLATRSPLLATFMTQDYEGENIADYESYLQMSPLSYQNGEFRLLKMNPKKNLGFRTIKPKKTFKMRGRVRITPIALSSGFNEGMQETLQNNVVKFTYLKDNLTTRELVATSNVETLYRYYEESYVQQALLNRTINYPRGYMHIPELGLSKYDESGTRALNFTRIQKMEIMNEIDPELVKYVTVDFSRIIPAMKHGIENIKNMDVLRMVYYELKGEQPNEHIDFYSLKTGLLYYIDMVKTTLSTTGERRFHDYMLTRPELFPTYMSGASTFEPPNKGFNLGFF